MGSLPAHLLFVLGLVRTMMWVVNEVKHREGGEFELGENGIAVCGLLDPFGLV